MNWLLAIPRSPRSRSSCCWRFRGACATRRSGCRSARSSARRFCRSPRSCRCGRAGTSSRRRSGTTRGCWPWSTESPSNSACSSTPSAAILLVTVTFVATCVQIYSLGYMHRDERKGWYYAVLSLFTAAMLALVLADNLLLLFVMWELMGLCSYLLIGFWYELEAPRKASQKAFLTTRVGDLGFLFALFVIYDAIGTWDLADVLSSVPELGPGRRDRGGDRTAHRPRWASPPRSRSTCGCPTRWPARRRPRRSSTRRRWSRRASSGRPHAADLPRRARGAARDARHRLDHRDRRRAARHGAARHQEGAGLLDDLASSGSCSWRSAPASVGAALFHLVTHAFFKSLLFLGAGVIIHAAHTQDMREMGGLAQAHAGDVGDLPHRLARARRRHAAVRLLQQGRDPRGAAARAQLLGVRRGDLGLAHHGVLHDAPVLPRLRGPRAGRAPPRRPHRR